MTYHIKGESRAQSTLFPETLDDYISEDNPVRVVDVFVDQLSLSDLGFSLAMDKRTGRPGYHPATMLKLYIYGYLNRIQSSRRLENESHRNVELMWLLERLTPDFKTIADFRKDNGEGIKQVCRQFVEICRKLNMFDGADFAIDGSKFKAVNNKARNFTPAKVKANIKKTEESIQKFMQQMDDADRAESGAVSVVSTEKLAWFKNRLAELKTIEKEVEAHPDKQVSQTDPDARLLSSNRLQAQVCYNVQTAVDTRHHLIVAHDIITTTDRGHITRVARLVQQAMRRADITIHADKGYFSRQDIKDAHDLGITANVPQVDTSGAAKKGIFNKSLFVYDKEKDVYTCPAGNTLPYQRIQEDRGVKQKIYLDHIACRDCNIRHHCTTSSYAPRRMRRWVHEDLIDEMVGRLKDNPQLPVIRKRTVEHPFGTMKMWMGATHFLTKRKKNVSTELSLSVLAYNLKRMINILGVSSLTKAIKT